jgi:hypothetical protein
VAPNGTSQSITVTPNGATHRHSAHNSISKLPLFRKEQIIRLALSAGRV